MKWFISVVLFFFAAAAFALTPQEILKDKIPVISATCHINAAYKMGNGMPIQRDCILFAEHGSNDAWVLIADPQGHYGAVVWLHNHKQTILWQKGRVSI